MYFVFFYVKIRDIMKLLHREEIRLKNSENNQLEMDLEKAIRSVDIDKVKRLLVLSPSSIDCKTDDNIPFALLAGMMGSLELTRYIVEYSRASMNLHDDRYRNILHYAVLSGNPESIPYLVERVGMSALEGDYEQQTPWDIAHNMGFCAMESYFEKYYQMKYEDTYHNPVRTGMFPDPSVIRVGDDYYMANSSFIFFPCIPISHSRDLVNWEIIGHAISNPEWAKIDELEGGRGYWAPDISYKNGRFYVTATYRMNETGSVIRRQIIVSSDRPEGPYSEPFYIDEDGIDPSLFHDDDGRTYMLLNRGARICEIDLENKKQLSPATLLYYGDQKRAPEGPHILKKDGWYYLFLAEGGTGEGHRITVARSRQLMGNYEPCPYNPIMRQWVGDAPIQRCGHGKPVMTGSGEWYMVYLCGRMIDGKYSMLGRETALDPVTWTPDGWPIVNQLNGPSSHQRKPKISENTLCHSIAKDNGEGFGEDRLSYDFMTPRTPSPDGIKVNHGTLKLKGSLYDLDLMSAKNIVVRRQTAFRFECSVVMDILSLKDGQDAGMTCYYDENTYLKFALFVKNDVYKIAVFEKVGDNVGFTLEKDVTEWINSLKQSSAPKIRFKIVTDYLKRSFFYSDANESDNMSCMGTIDNVYYLCDEGLKKGKRFTGAMVGVYGHTMDNDTFVTFENFSYKNITV